MECASDHSRYGIVMRDHRALWHGVRGSNERDVEKQFRRHTRGGSVSSVLNERHGGCCFGRSQDVPDRRWRRDHSDRESEFVEYGGKSEHGRDLDTQLVVAAAQALDGGVALVDRTACGIVR